MSTVYQFDVTSSSYMSNTGSWSADSGTYYYAIIPLEVGKAYKVTLQNVTTLSRFRVAQADSTEIGTATLSFVGYNDTPADGFSLAFVAEKAYLICYGGTANGGEVALTPLVLTPPTTGDISLSGRIWVANDTVDQNLGFPNSICHQAYSEAFNLDFVCNGVAYTKMVVNDGSYSSPSERPLNFYKSDNTKERAATGTAWSNPAYKTLTFPEGGNGHTSFNAILFLYRNGTFTPDIEELKDYKTVTFSFDVTEGSTSGAKPRLIIYPYSNDTKEMLGNKWVIDYSPKQDETVEIPFYKDIIYLLRIPNAALNGHMDLSLDGQALDGYSGNEEAVANNYRISGGETITITENYNSDGAIRWAFGLGETETPKTLITYNNETIATLEAGQTATIKTAETEVEHDIVITPVFPIEIAYGDIIATAEAGQTATVKCANTEADFDIVVSAKAESYSVSGIWEFNEPAEIEVVAFEENINFTMSGRTQNFAQIVGRPDRGEISGNWYNESGGLVGNSIYSVKNAYGDDRWINDNNDQTPTIDFGTQPQIVSEEFLTWLKANATKQ